MKQSEVEIYKLRDKQNDCWFKPIYEAYKGNLEDVTLTSHGWAMLRTLGEPANLTDKVQNRFELVLFSGCYDKLGIPIYQGDKLQIGGYVEGFILIQEVKFGNGMFYVTDSRGGDRCIGDFANQMEVVGNKFQSSNQNIEPSQE